MSTFRSEISRTSDTETTAVPSEDRRDQMFSFFPWVFVDLSVITGEEPPEAHL